MRSDVRFGFIKDITSDILFLSNLSLFDIRFIIILKKYISLFLLSLDPIC